MYLSEMKNGQISTCQWRTVRRLGSGKHGMADTQKTDVSVYTQKEIHRERTNMSNLIPFFSEYRYLWSANPLSAICLGTHVQTHIVIIVFVIFDCFLHLTGHVRNRRTNSSYWTVFTGFWTFGNKYSWMSRNKKRKHHCLFDHKVKVHPMTSQVPISYKIE